MTRPETPETTEAMVARMHAGAVAAVLDSACGYAAYSVMPPEASVLTVPGISG
jgi:acyl-coenzyme A thioesterase PaaI-like protein